MRFMRRLRRRNKISDCLKIVLDKQKNKEYNSRVMQESPSGMASASQADSGGFDSRFLLHEANSPISGAVRFLFGQLKVVGGVTE